MGLKLEKMLAECVRSTRLRKNMTQKELGEAAGYTRGYVCMIETRRSIPSVRSLVKLALALETTPDTLLSYNKIRSQYVSGNDVTSG